MITSGRLTFWHSVLYVCTHVSVSAVCFAMPAAMHSEETTEQAIRSVCERVGITSLKEKQREALKAIVCNKKDTFICLPTGYGKSLCYALLQLLFDKLLCREDGTSIVICISPLTAIMMEQRNKYVHSGISAEFIGEMQQDLDSMELYNTRGEGPVGVYKSASLRYGSNALGGDYRAGHTKCLRCVRTQYST